MVPLEICVLHWLPDENRWEPIDWANFLAFREFGAPFRPLEGVLGGIHHFAVCVLSDEGETCNIIPHKYMVEPDGRVGSDNFTGWTREERRDYERLMLSPAEMPGDHERLEEITSKGARAYYPPRDALYALIRALPAPPAIGSAAASFLDALR